MEGAVAGEHVMRYMRSVRCFGEIDERYDGLATSGKSAGSPYHCLSTLLTFASAH